jgi:hypothetical protein
MSNVPVFLGTHLDGMSPPRASGSKPVAACQSKVVNDKGRYRQHRAGEFSEFLTSKPHHGFSPHFRVSENRYFPDRRFWTATGALNGFRIFRIASNSLTTHSLHRFGPMRGPGIYTTLPSELPSGQRRARLGLEIALAFFWSEGRWITTNTPAC